MQRDTGQNRLKWRRFSPALTAKEGTGLPQDLRDAYESLAAQMFMQANEARLLERMVTVSEPVPYHPEGPDMMTFPEKEN